MNDQSDWQKLKGEAIWARHRGDLNNAVTLMSRAIQQATTKGVAEETISSMLNYYADLHILIGDFDSAESIIRKALKQSEELKLPQAGDDLLILSNILDAKGDLEAAFEAAENSLAIYKEFGHHHGVEQAQMKIDALILKKKKS